MLLVTLTSTVEPDPSQSGVGRRQRIAVHVVPDIEDVLRWATYAFAGGDERVNCWLCCRQRR